MFWKHLFFQYKTKSFLLFVIICSTVFGFAHSKQDGYLNLQAAALMFGVFGIFVLIAFVKYKQNKE